MPNSVLYANKIYNNLKHYDHTQFIALFILN